MSSLGAGSFVCKHCFFFFFFFSKVDNLAAAWCNLLITFKICFTSRGSYQFILRSLPFELHSECNDNVNFRLSNALSISVCLCTGRLPAFYVRFSNLETIVSLQTALAGSVTSVQSEFMFMSPNKREI